jgi:hypothetical protein
VTQREISKYCQNDKPVSGWLFRTLDPDSAILLRVAGPAVAELLQSPFTPITDGSGSFSFGALAIVEKTGLRRCFCAAQHPTNKTRTHRDSLGGFHG